jgi:hypothetical protein
VAIDHSAHRASVAAQRSADAVAVVKAVPECGREEKARIGDVSLNAAPLVRSPLRTEKVTARAVPPCRPAAVRARRGAGLQGGVGPVREDGVAPPRR